MMEHKEKSTAEERILAAAAKLFALQGYDGTTTRQIVSEAGSSLSMLQLNFGSKEVLYQKLLERTYREFVEKNISLFMEILEARENEPNNREVAWELIKKLTEAIVRGMFSKEYSYEIIIINRELMNKFQTFERLEPFMALFMNYELLFQSYAGIYDQSTAPDWAKALSFATVTSLLNYASYPRVIGYFMNMDLSNEINRKKVMSFARDYQLSAIKANLDSYSNQNDSKVS